MNGTITASTTMVKEREAGTLEQLLMTPAGMTEIIVAKIVPPFVLLSVPAVVALIVIRFYFEVPFNGSVPIVAVSSALCLLCGIGLGTAVATITKSAQQAQLATFFITPPLMSLSGAMSPAEAMPAWMRPWTALNPVYHFGVISRASLDQGQRARRTLAARARPVRLRRRADVTERVAIQTAAQLIGEIDSAMTRLPVSRRLARVCRHRLHDRAWSVANGQRPHSRTGLHCAGPAAGAVCRGRDGPGWHRWSRTQTPIPGATDERRHHNPIVQVQGAFAGSREATAAALAGALSLQDALRRGVEYNLGALNLTEVVNQARGQRAAVAQRAAAERGEPI